MMKRLVLPAAVLFLFSIAAMPAVGCFDEYGNKVACEQDPPPGDGGGGGPICANPTCWGCGEPESDGWAPCVQGTSLKPKNACNCNYSGGICSNYGSCTVTGP